MYLNAGLIFFSCLSLWNANFAKVLINVFSRDVSFFLNVRASRLLYPLVVWRGDEEDL